VSQNQLLELKIHSYWHIGSTAAAGPDVDAEPARTAWRLPYVPGRTLRGLLRDAMRLTATFDGIGFTMGDVARWFGSDPTGDDPDSEQREKQIQSARWRTEPGLVRVGSAELGKSEAERSAWQTLGRCGKGEVDRLFHRIAQTAVDEETGVAATSTLRSQRVAVPMVLWASLTVPDTEALKWRDAVRKSLPQLVELGSHRTRGFGRVTCALHDADAASDVDVGAMPAGCTSALVELTLLEPVVVSSTSASTGSHESLDFIPGAMLLGAVASKQYDPGEARTWSLFHSGEVQFGDCAPVDGNGKVLTRAPLSRHTAKGESGNIKDFALEPRENVKQWAQNRSAFLPIENSNFSVAKSYGLRTSMKAGLPLDGMLYGYESLNEGQRFAGRLNAATPELMAVLWVHLQGQVVHLGRAKAAEFGAVHVRLSAEKASQTSGPSAGAKSFVVRLDSDACLLDGDTAQPRLQLQPADLALPDDWKVDWERTFVRSRRWRPFHGARKRPAMERQVLVGGSIATFEGPPLTAVQAAAVQSALLDGIGLFRTEGLGRVAVHVANRPVQSLKEVPGRPSAEDSARILAKDPVYRAANERQALLLASDDEAVLIAGGAKSLAAYKLPKAQWGALRQFAQREPGLANDGFFSSFLEGKVRTVLWARRKGDKPLRQQLLELCTNADGKPRTTAFVAQLAAATAKAQGGK
jgi:hypothetical protein